MVSNNIIFAQVILQSAFNLKNLLYISSVFYIIKNICEMKIASTQKSAINSLRDVIAKLVRCDILYCV